MLGLYSRRCGSRSVRADSVLWTISVLALIGFAVTLGRLPIDSGDAPFYASIARSLQLRGVGIPSVLKDGPTAVDHVQFYGPVFFHLAARLFAWFGFSSVAFRELSLLGAILVAFGGVAVCSALGGGRDRQAWACALLLLSPELGLMATFGRMDTLAVGFEMLGLAVFLHGLTDSAIRGGTGSVSAALFGAAALTTPRSFPFMLGFAVAADRDPAVRAARIAPPRLGAAGDLRRHRADDRPRLDLSCRSADRGRGCA